MCVASLFYSVPLALIEATISFIRESGDDGSISLCASYQHVRMEETIRLIRGRGGVFGLVCLHRAD